MNNRSLQIMYEKGSTFAVKVGDADENGVPITEQDKKDMSKAEEVIEKYMVDEDEEPRKSIRERDTSKPKRKR